MRPCGRYQFRRQSSRHAANQSAKQPVTEEKQRPADLDRPDKRTEESEHRLDFLLLARRMRNPPITPATAPLAPITTPVVGHGAHGVAKHEHGRSVAKNAK